MPSGEAKASPPIGDSWLLKKLYRKEEINTMKNTKMPDTIAILSHACNGCNKALPLTGQQLRHNWIIADLSQPFVFQELVTIFETEVDLEITKETNGKYDSMDLAFSGDEYPANCVFDGYAKALIAEREHKIEEAKRKKEVAEAKLKAYAEKLEGVLATHSTGKRIQLMVGLGKEKSATVIECLPAGCVKEEMLDLFKKWWKDSEVIQDK